MQLVNILNGNGNIISKIKLESSATAPVAGDYIGGLAGAMYHNTTSGAAMFFNGSEWIPVSKIVGVTGQTTVTYTGNPVSAVVGLDPAVVGSFLPLSGGTMSGILYNNVGISATSISAVNFYGKVNGTSTSALSADQATHLATARNFSIAGTDVSSAPIAFDGQSNVVLVGDLKPTGVSAGSYGTNVYIPNFIVDSKGRITSATQQALSISGANGGTVTSIGVSSTTLSVSNSPVTVSGTISVGLASIGSGGTGVTKVTYDQYGRITSSGYLTSSDIPAVSNLYVPISGGTMTGGLTAPTATFTSGVNVTSDGMGVKFYGGTAIYKKVGTGIVLRMDGSNSRPQVETNSGVTVGTIWDSGNLTGHQTGHDHYTQFSGTSGINYVSATGTFGLATTDTAGTYVKVVTDVYGRVTSGGPMVASDVPSLSGQYLGVGLSAVANGVASLDGSGKVPVTQLPPSVFGQVHYAGLWNATSGSTMPAASSVSGAYYITSVSGSTTPTGGFSSQTLTQISATSATMPWFNVGDWLVSNGTTWDKVDNTDAISTWNGRIGNVVPVSGDYTATQVNSTATGSVTATNVQAAIAQLATLDSAKVPLSGGTMTGVLNNNVGISATSISAVSFYDTNFVGGKALVSVGKQITELTTVNSTEVGYLSGTSANIQEQINSKLGGNLSNVDDLFIPMWSSATNGFVNSTAATIGGDQGVVAATDKMSVAANDEHGPGIGVNIGYRPTTSASARGFRINTGLQNEFRVWQGTWYNPINWVKTLEITSAGALSLPLTLAGATSALVGVNSAGTLGRYILTSADLPIVSLSNLYVPISGGTMNGNLIAPSITATNITGTLIGLASSATKLATPRAFNATGDVSAAAVNFDGTANVTLSMVLPNVNSNVGTFTKVTVNSKGLVTAAGNLLTSDIPSLAGAYLPLSGGNMNGDIKFNYNNVSADNLGIYGRTGSGNDGWRIIGQTTGSDSGALEIATGDNGNEPIYVRQYNDGVYSTSAINRTLTLLDGSGNTTLPGSLKVQATPSSGGTYSGTLKIDTTGLIYKDTNIVDHKRWSTTQTIGFGTNTISATHGLGTTTASVRCFITTTGEPVMLEPNYSTSTPTVMVFTTNSSTTLNTTIIIEV